MLQPMQLSKKNESSRWILIDSSNMRGYFLTKILFGRFTDYFPTAWPYLNACKTLCNKVRDWVERRRKVSEFSLNFR